MCRLWKMLSLARRREGDAHHLVFFAETIQRRAKPGIFEETSRLRANVRVDGVALLAE